MSALAPLAEACTGSSDDAVCSFVARIYDLGLGVAVQPEKAQTLWRAACGKGAVEACSLLGHSFLDGAHGPKDEVQAADAFNTGCWYGDVEACLRIGAFCDVLRADPARAADHQRICSLSGGLNSHSRGAEQQAAYQEACEAGHADLCLRAWQVEPDPGTAWALRQRACRSGVAEACTPHSDDPVRSQGWPERLRTVGL